MPTTHIADAQIRQLMRSIDTDGDGVIQYNEFVAKFGLKKKTHAATPNESEKSSDSEENEPWMTEFVKGLGAAMQRAKSSLQDLFSKFDHDNDGVITYDEFFRTLQDMECPLSLEEMRKVALHVDLDKDGYINISEFASSFYITSPSAIQSGSWEDRVKDQLLRTFYQHKAALLHVFHSYDQTSSGLLSEEQFTAGIQALLSVEHETIQMSDETVYQLAASLSDEKGLIDYGKFIEGFNVSRS